MTTKAKYFIAQVRMVPFRCKACKSGERPHVGRGLCTRCYGTDSKRKYRAKQRKAAKKGV